MTDLHKRPSASPFVSPGLYLIETSYRDNSFSHRCPVAFSFAVDKRHMSMGYLSALQICWHTDIHGICGKHSTSMTGGGLGGGTYLRRGGGGGNYLR